jgi:hypothetical protein
MYRVRSVMVSAAVVLGFALPTAAATRYRFVNATGSGTCSSWADACTLSYALDPSHVVTGDEIWVAAGTYRPSVRTDPNDPRSATFQLKSGVAIYGGFAGVETRRATCSGGSNNGNACLIASECPGGTCVDARSFGCQGGPNNRRPCKDSNDCSGWTCQNATILSGDLEGDDGCTVDPTSTCCSAHSGDGCCAPQPGCAYDPENPDPCASKVCHHVDPNLSYCCGSPNPIGWNDTCAFWAHQLCLCVCTAGDTLDNSYHVVTATDTTATAVLDGFTIKAGRANGTQTAGTSGPDPRLNGAGAYMTNGSPQFVGCTFLTNVASGKGGGVYIKTGSPSFTNCVLSDNSAGSYGGGVYMEGGSPTFTGCTFTSNSATEYGGGVYNTGGKPTLTNCVFDGNGNEATLLAGGGIYSAGSTSPGTTLTGCSFTNNTASSGAGVALRPVITDTTTVRTAATLTDCTFTGNHVGDIRGDGGGLSLIQTDATLAGCTFSNNSSGSSPGGGIAIASISVATLNSCEFDGNAGSHGGGVSVGTSDATLTGCAFVGNSVTQDGGGLYLSDGASVTVTGGGLHQSVLQNNEAAGYGGGVAVVDSVLILRSSTLRGNYARYGGGVSTTKGAYATIEDCVIEGNGQSGSNPTLVAQWGGGIALDISPDHSQTVARSVIRNNRAQYGGGIDVTQHPSGPVIPVVLEGCAVTGNSSEYGGGISVRFSVAPKLVNCTVAGNDASNGGGLWSIAGDVTVDNSVFWGNTASTLAPQISAASDTTVRFSDIEGGPAEMYVDPAYTFDWQLSNIDIDPAFVNAFNGDYHLSGGASPSPCIDAGNNLLAVGLLDVERHPRIAGCKVDMGAYEYAAILLEPPTPETNPIAKNRFISFFPGNPGKNAAIRVKLLSMHHPNPANAPAYPAHDFSRFENQVRWVGAPIEGFESDGPPSSSGHFVAGTLDCQPFYRDWSLLGEDVVKACSPNSQEGYAGKPCVTDTDCGNPFYGGTCLGSTNHADDLLHVTGAAIVPSSVYEVQLFDQGQVECGDRLEGMFSAPLTIPTARWGDVAAAFSPPSPTPQPDAIDVLQLVNTFKGVIGAPKKVVAMLIDNVPDPRRGINALDIVAAVDAFLFKAYPFADRLCSGNNRTPCNVDADCSAAGGSCVSALGHGPDACPCSPNIRVDSNNDGVIDAADDSWANVSPGVIIYVNDDDDNFDGVPDLDESPVPDENDLAEIQLPRDCYPLNPATAWWSIWWTDVDPTHPTMKVWLTPDKSDGQGGAGTPLPNDPYLHHLWPPPASVWAEAQNPFDDVELMFTVSDDGTGTQRTDGVDASGKSTIRVDLRVVLVVEPGADLDNPLRPTGGCLMSRNTVDSLVVVAMKDISSKGGAYNKTGISWRWGTPGNLKPIVRLESGCMQVVPVGSDCADVHTLGDNPRLLPVDWYADNVVGQDGRTAASLIGPCLPPPSDQCCDGDSSHGSCPAPGVCCLGFDPRLCTLNVYFIGNATRTLPSGILQDALGWTDVPVAPDNGWVLVSDSAGQSLSNDANPLVLVDERILEHEFFCHWIGADSGHIVPPPDGFGCLDDDPDTPCDTKALCSAQQLCYQGSVLEFCLHKGYPMYRLDETRLTNGKTRLGSCGARP